MTDHEIFDLGATSLSCGVTVPSRHLTYKVYGQLNGQKSNLID